MAAEIDGLWGRIYGQPCWGVHWDCNTGLRLNFGKPHLEVREPKAPLDDSSTPIYFRYRDVYVRGDWVLWCSALWRLSLADIPAVTGSSSYRRIMMGESRLDGQKLEVAAINASTGATRLSFDLGATLEFRRFGRGDTEGIYSLHTPDGHYLEVFGDGTYHLEPGDCRNPEQKPVAAGLRSNTRMQLPSRHER